MPVVTELSGPRLVIALLTVLEVVEEEAELTVSILLVQQQVEGMGLSMVLVEVERVEHAVQPGPLMLELVHLALSSSPIRRQYK